MIAAGGHDIIIGVSIGVAMSPDDGNLCPEALLSHAGQALYQAKVGRGGYVFADDMPSARPAFEELAVRLASVRPRKISTAARARRYRALL